MTILFYLFGLLNALTFLKWCPEVDWVHHHYKQNLSFGLKKKKYIRFLTLIISQPNWMVVFFTVKSTGGKNTKPKRLVHCTCIIRLNENPLDVRFPLNDFLPEWLFLLCWMQLQYMKISTAVLFKKVHRFLKPVVVTQVWICPIFFFNCCILLGFLCKLRVAVRTAAAKLFLV